MEMKSERPLRIFSVRVSFGRVNPLRPALGGRGGKFWKPRPSPCLANGRRRRALPAAPCRAHPRGPAPRAPWRSSDCTAAARASGLAARWRSGRSGVIGTARRGLRPGLSRATAPSRVGEGGEREGGAAAAAAGRAGGARRWARSRARRRGGGRRGGADQQCQLIPTARRIYARVTAVPVAGHCFGWNSARVRVTRVP